MTVFIYSRFTIYHLHLYQLVRRVHADELRVNVYLDADALGERDEVLALLLVTDDEHGRLATGVEHLAAGAAFQAPDRLDAAAFQLPVVELALFQLDRLRFGDGQLAARERRGRLRTVEAFELQDDAVAVEPVAFELEAPPLPVGEDRDDLFEPVEALGEVGQEGTGYLDLQPARLWELLTRNQLYALYIFSVP